MEVGRVESTPGRGLALVRGEWQTALIHFPLPERGGNKKGLKGTSRTKNAAAKRGGGKRTLLLVERSNQAERKKFVKKRGGGRGGEGRGCNVVPPR